MAPISQPPPHIVRANVRQKQSSVPLIFLTASAALYVGAVIFGTLAASQHLYLLLLLLQYIAILPIAVWFLRSRSGSKGYCGLPRINHRIALIAFELLAIPLSRFAVQGLLNPDESAYSFQARLY